MSLMLLATLKIVSCLKNYCYHHDDNTHIANLLHLPQPLQKHVLSEFEYQLQLYNYYSDHHICTSAERDLALHNTTFSSLSCMRLE